MITQYPTGAGGTAVLFRTHFWDDFAQRQFDRLLARAHGTDVFVLVDETGGPVAGIPHDKVVRTTEAELLGMGFARAGEGNLLWFNGDYPLYRFMEIYPDYDQYLQLEYDVAVTMPLAEFAARAKELSADFVGLTKGEPPAEWFWRESCAEAYDAASVRHQLICLSLFSSRALRHLWRRRLELSQAYRRGALKAWPFCEGFIPTELALAGMRCVELDAFGGTEAYDHWPPYLEADLGEMRGQAFVHPVLDPPRYVASLQKYQIGLSGYLNPASAFHRKLRRLPVRDYASALTTSFAAKAARTIRQAGGHRA
jgi:hypothetical protein